MVVRTGRLVQGGQDSARSRRCSHHRKCPGNDSRGSASTDEIRRGHEPDPLLRGGVAAGTAGPRIEHVVGRAGTHDVRCPQRIGVPGSRIRLQRDPDARNRLQIVRDVVLDVCAARQAFILEEKMIEARIVLDPGMVGDVVVLPLMRGYAQGRAWIPSPSSRDLRCK